VAFIIVGIVVVLGGALVLLLATGRRRATTGRLSRETRQRDDSTPPVGTELATTDDASEDARARADESRAAAGAVPARRTSGTPARYEPVDPEELGVTRRQFFNRGLLTGLALGVSGFGAAALAFLWPSTAGGAGTKVNLPLADVEASIAKKEPYYNATARTYIQPYPKDALPKAKKVYGNEPGVIKGMEEGFVALYQKCPHLGCRVPWCQTSQWFECPCHGSKYNRVGEKKGGPAPRGMDRFSMEVAGNSIVVDTAVVVQGPPIGTDTTGQGQEGAACV
jgi:cytochrome b6-f complex iron-sulfur subunit